MAYDKIITIRARLDDCLRYIQDGEKTALSLAMDYIEDSGKTTLDDASILSAMINLLYSGLIGNFPFSSFYPILHAISNTSNSMKQAWNLHAVCSVTNMKPSFAPISTRNTCTAILYSTLFHSWME